MRQPWGGPFCEADDREKKDFDSKDAEDYGKAVKNMLKGKGLHISGQSSWIYFGLKLA